MCVLFCQFFGSLVVVLSVSVIVRGWYVCCSVYMCVVLFHVLLVCFLWCPCVCCVALLRVLVCVCACGVGVCVGGLGVCVLVCVCVCVPVCSSTYSGDVYMCGIVCVSCVSGVVLVCVGYPLVYRVFVCIVRMRVRYKLCLVVVSRACCRVRAVCYECCVTLWVLLLYTMEVCML